MKYGLSRKGFTLVELLVIIGLISVICAVGFLSVTAFNRNQKFTNTSNEVYSQILYAKSSAQSQVFPSDGNCTSPLVGYRVILGDGYYGVVPVCSNGAYTLSADKKKLLPTGVSFTPVQNFTFNVLTGLVSEAASSGTIVKLKDASHTKNIKVYQDGRIEIY